MICNLEVLGLNSRAVLYMIRSFQVGKVVPVLIGFKGSMPMIRISIFDTLVKMLPLNVFLKEYLIWSHNVY